MKHLHLSSDLSLPVNAVTQTFAFLARRGAGKSYGASKLAEEMLEVGGQVVVVDPVGVWWGLRLAADGKGKGFAIPVFGGLHGDIPLEAGAGAMVADLVVDRGVSAVLDVSMFRKGDRKRFVTDFAEQLFHRKKSSRSPLHVFIEEAQVFVPQRVMGDEARMLGAFEDLVKLGRNFGIGVTLISQRPQAVNKDALNQTECLVVLQTNGSQERKALKEWIVDQGLDVDLLNDLPGLPIGTAWVWSPQWLGVLKKVKIAKKRTFNASATPEVGDKQVEPRELAPVDLEAIRQDMKDVVERAETNDPKALRRRITELESQLRKGSPTKVEVKEVPVLGDAQVRELEQAARRIEAAMTEAAKLSEFAQAILMTLETLRKPTAPSPGRVLTVAPAPPRGHAKATDPLAEKEDPEGLVIKKGAREMLRALASRHPTPLSKRQVATLAGFSHKGGTFSDYLSTLRRAGFVKHSDGGDLVISTEGLGFIGHVPAPQTTVELVALWGQRLKRGARQMLGVLVEAYPRGLSREELAAAVSMEPTGGTFSDYLSALRSNGLAEKGSDGIRASATLFPGERAT